MHKQLADRFGTRYAVERKMHRDTIIYYVFALDPNGDLAARACTSQDLLACVPAFIARAVLSLKHHRINEVMIWPDHRRRGFSLVSADRGGPRKTAAAEPHLDGGGPSVLEGKKSGRGWHSKRRSREWHFPIMHNADHTRRMNGDK
jgi:hypothetical protein